MIAAPSTWTSAAFAATDDDVARANGLAWNELMDLRDLPKSPADWTLFALRQMSIIACAHEVQVFNADYEAYYETDDRFAV